MHDILRHGKSMITKPTVLVLGAGASIPFNFPSGMELKGIIVNKLIFQKDLTWVNVMDELGFDEKKRINFGFNLMRAALQSVDIFLEYRPEYTKIGKTCMALALIPYEKENIPYQLTIEGKGNWYDCIWSLMHCPFGEVDCNNLAFINFNYDRSLEHFLFNCFHATYGNEGRTKDDINQKLKKIRVIHVYGNLGYLPWQGSPSREYYERLDNYNVVTARDQIRIIGETEALSPELKESRELLRAAERIYFLGFGYHETNMKRLLIDELIEKPKFGTSYKLSQTECGRITSRWNVTLPNSEYDVLRFLREYAVLD